MKNFTFSKLLPRFAYQGQFKLENLLPGLNGQTLGSNLSTIDLSGVTTLTLPAGTTIGGSSVVALATITSNSANALTAGPNGTTNPSFNVDASTSSAATGLNVKSAAAGSGVSVSVISSGTNEGLTLDAKGSGVIAIGSTSTGAVVIGRGSRSALILGSTLTALGTVQNTTPTAAQLLGGYLSHNSTTGAGTATLPTGTNISTAISGVTTGDSFSCVYANIGSQTVTITGATGSTVVGTAAIPAGKNAILDFYCTGSNTWNVYVTVSA